MGNVFVRGTQDFDGRWDMYIAKLQAVPWLKIIFAGVSAYLILQFLAFAVPLVLFIALALAVWKLIKN